MNRREFIGGIAALSAVGWRKAALAAGYPAYYAERFAAAAARINALAPRCRGGFWFVTDLHISSNRLHSGELLAAFAKATPLRDVLCGGDLPEAFTGRRFATDRAAIEDVVRLYREKWVGPIRAAGGRVYTARGNHDFTICREPDSKVGATFGGAESRRLVVDEFTERGVVTNADDPEGCYYYFDDAANGIRHVVADTTDSQQAGDTVAWGVRAGMHERQLKWLAGTALAGVPGGWGVLVMHHIPITGFVGNGGEEKTFADFRRLLESYQNRGTFECGGGRFDFGKAGGRILMDLTGHHHCERQTFRNGIVHCTQPCDVAYDDYLIGSRPRKWDLPKKTWNTVNEQTFDAVQFDASGEMAHFTRVGGGANREVHLKPLKVTVGGTLQLKTTCLTGDVRWLCHDGDRYTTKPNPESRWCPLIVTHEDFATVTDGGLLTAKAPGTVMAVAYLPDGTREIFPVVVSER